MIFYKNKEKDQCLDVFADKKGEHLTVYIKSGKTRCKVKCCLATETIVIHDDYKNRKYSKEQISEINTLLSYKFDLTLPEYDFEKKRRKASKNGGKKSSKTNR